MSRRMEPKREEWLVKLVKKLDYPELYLNIGKDTVGYVYNRVKDKLWFINEKEARRLTRKGIIWKRLGEDWDVRKPKST